MMDAQAVVYLDDKETDFATLEQLLRQTAQNAPETEVQLRADESVPYGKVIALMGLAREAGLQKIGFVTQPASEASAQSQP
jgi:biopolymer transport protein TolR